MPQPEQPATAAPRDLPLPETQLFYALATENSQEEKLPVLIDLVHYPTLGCPALVGPGARLQVLLCLRTGLDAGQARFFLEDRHRQAGTCHELRPDGPAEEIGASAPAERTLVRVWFEVEALPHALYDLRVEVPGQSETQYNAVRTYEHVSGSEKVLFCGDSQYHLENARCLKRFVERVNDLDVAWIAMIGDVCDNAIKGKLNLIALAAHAVQKPVTQYYDKEYIKAHEQLRELRHPIVLVPGNHDGMAAYPRYNPGKESAVFLGIDGENRVAYDGLHHFRRTFGPLYFRFDWAGTRYLCTNTFELTRQQRLGYHGIVANWGGWIRPEQQAWIAQELAGAGTMKKVMLMHHDPRGGCEGKNLGRYHKLRRYEFDSKWRILKSYLSYVGELRRIGWQQEWMAASDDLDTHPVKDLLSAMLEHRVWAVVMGHDNENWIDSYYEGGDLFVSDPSTVTYATRSDVGDDDLVDDTVGLLQTGDFARLHDILSKRPASQAEAALQIALHEIAEEEMAAEIVYSDDPAKKWDLKIRSAIHFVHVDDVGAYKYDDDDFDRYGFVVAQLSGGAPVELQSHRIAGAVGAKTRLQED
jgi:hypothetical protein